MIIKDIKFLNKEWLSEKIAYKFFKERCLRSGNIIAFASPVSVEGHKELNSDMAMNFMWELHDASVMSAVCVQRLYNSLVANMLSSEAYLNGHIELDGEHIIVHQEHNQGGVTQLHGRVSMNKIINHGNCCVGYLGIHIQAGNNAPAYAFSSGLNDAKANEFMLNCCREYYGMMQSIFLGVVNV